MDTLVIAGALLSVVGLGGLVRCIQLALRIRREGGTDDEIRARLQKLLPLNLGALAVSALGLMLVVTGVILA